MLGALDCVQHFQLLVKSLRAKKCLEVGCYTGYTAMSLAQALPDDGQVITLDISGQRVAFDIWKKAGVDHKVIILKLNDFKIYPSESLIYSLKIKVKIHRRTCFRKHDTTYERRPRGHVRFCVCRR